MTEENIKIAVIDDEESVRESLKYALQIKDYDIELYEKAEDFLKNFSKGIYDVIFLDLFLKNDPLPYSRPSRDGGIEVLKKIVEIDPDTMVIILTGYPSESSKANAITIGAMEYLQKPPMIEDIYELVTRGLRKRREKKTKRKDTGPIGPIH